MSFANYIFGRHSLQDPDKVSTMSDDDKLKPPAGATATPERKLIDGLKEDLVEDEDLKEEIKTQYQKMQTAYNRMCEMTEQIITLNEGNLISSFTHSSGAHFKLLLERM